MMRLVEPSRRIDEIAAKDHATGMFATSHSASALGCFDNPATLGPYGSPIGPILPAGGLFSYDAWEVYRRRHRFRVTNTNMVVSGELGAGKSTTVQIYLRRQWPLGRYIRAIDPSPAAEYRGLAEDLGGQVIRVAKGGDVTLNPLESPENRHALLRGMAEAAARRPLTELEPALLNTALDACDGVPILPAVLDRLFHPTQAMLEKVSATDQQFREEARRIAMALQPLCAGDLRGLFDGPTTADVDFHNRFVLLDLSSLHDSQSLGILMACATSFLQAQIDQHFREGVLVGEPPKSILVIDEAWKILSLPGIGEWLQDSYKMSRKRATQNIAVLHAIGRDLDAAGADGDRIRKLAVGLARDSSTFVTHRISDERDAAETQVLIGLSDVERDLVMNGLDRGDALWRIGEFRAAVMTLATEDDLRVTSPDKAMTG